MSQKNDKKDLVVGRKERDQQKIIRALLENMNPNKSLSIVKKIEAAKYVRLFMYKDHTVVVYVSKTDNLHVGTACRKYEDKKNRDVGIVLACLCATGKRKESNIYLNTTIATKLFVDLMYPDKSIVNSKKLDKTKWVLK